MKRMLEKAINSYKNIHIWIFLMHENIVIMPKIC